MKQPDQIWTVEELETLRSAAIEECALLVAERAIWTSDRDLKDGLIAVAAAIRALKDKP